MRKWGVLISIIYAVIVLGLLTPIAVLLAGPSDLHDFVQGVLGAYREWLVWVPVIIVLGGQALLLFLSVDTSQKRLKPRSPILFSCALAGILIALLTFAVVGAIGVAAKGDKFGEGTFASPFLFFGLAWLFLGNRFLFLPAQLFDGRKPNCFLAVARQHLGIARRRAMPRHRAPAA